MQKKFRLTSILMLVSILPVVVSLALCTVVSSNYMKNMTESEIEETLMSTGYSVLGIFTSIDDGEYRLVDSVLYKGETNLEEHMSIVDGLKDETDIEVTLFYEDTRYLTTIMDTNGNRSVHTKCSDEVKEEVLNGNKSYFTNDIVIGGNHYYGYYIPIKDNGMTVGMVFTGKPSEDVTASIGAYVKYIAAFSLGATLIAVLICFFIGIAISKKIKGACTIVQDISEGKLNKEVVNDCTVRELYTMVDSCSKLRQKLIDNVTTIKECSSTVSISTGVISESMDSCEHATTDLNAAMNDLSCGAQNMAESVERQATELSGMSDNIARISGLAREALSTAESVNKLSDKAKDNLDSLLVANESTNQGTVDVVSSVKDMGASIEEITAASKIIMEISSQTNLLSLNASIEAARAGDAGKGFAVVAGEIQKLAEQSNQSAKQIHDIIKEITEKSIACMSTAHEIQDAVSHESEVLLGVKSSFESVDKNVGTVTEIVSEVSELSTVIDESKVHILDSVSDLSGISEENAASAEMTHASANELKCECKRS